MFAKTQDEVRRIYDSVNTIKRLSDRIIGIGPINIIGLDGILAWIPIPGLGTVYSVLAGGFILYQGVRARCDATTLAGAFLALLVDAGISTTDTVIPILGSAVDTFFQGHLYAAHMIQKDIDKTLYIEGSASQAHRDGSHQDNVGEMRNTKGKKRLVYLGN